MRRDVMRRDTPGCANTASVRSVDDDDDGGGGGEKDEDGEEECSRRATSRAPVAVKSKSRSRSRSSTRADKKKAMLPKQACHEDAANAVRPLKETRVQWSSCFAGRPSQLVPQANWCTTCRWQDLEWARWRWGCTTQASSEASWLALEQEEDAERVAG